MEAKMQALTQYFQKRWIDSGLMSGATVAICRKDGVVYREHFGDNKPDSMYVCYSLTKIITTVACLQLQETGKLHLDDPVAKHLMEFRKPRQPGLASENADITIRQCLNHTSGLSYVIGIVNPTSLWEPAEHAEAKKRAKLPTHKQRVAHISEQSLLFPPGTRFNYAEAHAVVASVVESVSGKTFSQYLDNHVFGPLNMDSATFLTSRAQKGRIPDTYYDTMDLDHPVPSFIVGFLRRFFSKIPAALNDLNFNAEMITGDAGIKGDVDDFLLFNRMLLNGGELLGGARILAESSVREMCTSSLPVGAELSAPFAFCAAPPDEKRSRPQRRLDAVARQIIGPGVADAPTFGIANVDGNAGWRYRPLNSYPGQSFGLGVAIIDDPVRAGVHPRAKGTCWWQGLASTYFAFNPETDIGVLVFSQRVSCVTRQQALADVISAAHEMLL